MFIGLLSTCITGHFGEPLASSSKGRMKCVPLNNQPCQAKPRLANTNSNELLCYHLLSALIIVMEAVILLVIQMLDFLFQIK